MKLPCIPERYFNYLYQFIVLFAVIAFGFILDDNRELLLGALIGVMIGLPLQEKTKGDNKNG